MDKYTIDLTQEEVDHLHLVLGFSNSRAALSLLSKVDTFVSDEEYNNYEKIKFTFTQEDGMANFIISEVE